MAFIPHLSSNKDSSGVFRLLCNESYEPKFELLTFVPRFCRDIYRASSIYIPSVQIHKPCRVLRRNNRDTWGWDLSLSTLNMVRQFMRMGRRYWIQSLSQTRWIRRMLMFVGHIVLLVDSDLMHSFVRASSTNSTKQEVTLQHSMFPRHIAMRHLQSAQISHLQRSAKVHGIATELRRGSVLRRNIFVLYNFLFVEAEASSLDMSEDPL